MEGLAPDPGVLRPYVLGHTPQELDRLLAQARLIDPVTERFLRAAGIAPGMRVLDVGTGLGDVAFVAADLVGPGGEVVGVDRAGAAVAAATGRALTRGSQKVTFQEGDPAEMTFDEPFDAVIGRYVLQFQADPAAMLRRVSGHLRPGGLAVFHEIDWAGISSFPPSPIYDRSCDWAVRTLRATGTETRMGAKLYATFVNAGLPAPQSCDSN